MRTLAVFLIRQRTSMYILSLATLPNEGNKLGSYFSNALNVNKCTEVRIADVNGALVLQARGCVCAGASRHLSRWLDV